MDIKAIVGLIFLLAIGYLLYNKLIKYPYNYICYFYPEIENMDKWAESGPLNSLNECRDWAGEMADTYGAKSGTWDYECGKDCYKGDPYNQGVTYTCKTSVD